MNYCDLIIKFNLFFIMEYNCETCNRVFSTRLRRGVHQARCKWVAEDSAVNTMNHEHYDQDEDFTDLAHSDGTFNSDEYEDYENFFQQLPNTPNRSVITYLTLQEHFFKASYSIDALRNSIDIHDLISRLPKMSEKDAVYNK